MRDATALSRLLAGAGLTPSSVTEEPVGIVARIEPDEVLAALTALAADTYAMLVDLLGADTGSGIELTWHVRSFASDEDVYVKALAAYDSELPSVWTVYASALYSEREIAELLGLTLIGHPNPKRLLTSEEAEPNLLRKSTPIRTREELVRPGVRGGESE